MKNNQKSTSERSNTLSITQKRIIAIFIGIILPLFALEFVFRILPVNDARKMLPINDSNKIARREPNRDFTWSKGKDFSIIATKHTNNYGFINDQDYSTSETSPLMAIIGDSFVQANQLENSLTMYGVLAAMVGETGRVYSFGNDGSNLPTYLAFAEYARNEFAPDAMVFIITGNDFDESLFKYHKQAGNHYFFTTDSGELVFDKIDYESGLLKKIARESALFRYLVFNLEIQNIMSEISANQLERRINFPTEASQEGEDNTEEGDYVGFTSIDTGQERVLDSEKAVDEFFRQLPLRSGLNNDAILFVIDALRPAIYFEQRLQEAEGTYYDVMRKYFISKAQEEGYEVIDMNPIFISEYKEEGIKFEFETDGHWNVFGHTLAAQAIESTSVYTNTFGEKIE